MVLSHTSIPSKVGISLKSPHYETILNTKPSVPWFEVHPENLKSGTSLSIVEKIREEYPLSLHGVGLSLGSPDLNLRHLSFLKSLCHRLEPGLVSEHVAWNYIEGEYINDLLPLPYTDEALDVLVCNIQRTQEYLNRSILVENPSTYLEFSHSTYTEWDFIKEVSRRSGCKVLLDLNNIYVNAQNHGFDSKDYIKCLVEGGSVGEIHLAGHKEVSLERKKMLLVDHHGSTVSSEVWALYEYCLSLLKNPVPTLVEWDNHLPSFEMLLAEGKKAQFYMEKRDETIRSTASV